MKSNHYFARFLLPIASVAVLAVAVLWSSPRDASALVVTPDSVEYAIAANNHAFRGNCGISYCGRWFPMRYPPWFSLFVLSPAYKMLGAEIGLGVIPVFLFGLSGVFLAYFIGFKLAGRLGGTLAALALLSLPSYAIYAKLIMTDVPATALFLACGLLFIIVSQKKRQSFPLWFAAGFAAAACAALRPLMAVTALPFLILAVTEKDSIRNKTAKTAALSLAPAVLAVAVFQYDTMNFGAPFRNGYNYWCPIPYDYPTLTFSFGNITRNLSIAYKTFLPFLILLGVAISAVRFRGESRFKKNFRLGESPFGSVVFFLLVASVPILIFHLLYFYPDKRFFLPVEALGSVIIAASAAKFANDKIKNEKFAWIPYAVAFALFFIALKSAPPSPYERFSSRKDVAAAINSATPANAVVISSIDPVYLNFMTRLSVNSDRIIIPTSREVEYASKIIAPRSIPKLDPPPSNPFNHRDSRLLSMGAEEAIPWTALDSTPAILALSAQGRPLYIDNSFMSKEEFEIFRRLYSEHFTCSRVAKNLFLLRPSPLH